jgi:hypothetical protein
VFDTKVDNVCIFCGKNMNMNETSFLPTHDDVSELVHRN